MPHVAHPIEIVIEWGYKTMRSISMISKLAECASLAGVIAIAAAAAGAWSELPERIPIHFGVSGTPDGWGSRDTIWVLVVACVLIYAVMFLGQWRKDWINIPFRINKDDPKVAGLLFEMMSVLKAGVLIGMLVLILSILEVARGRAESLHPASVFLLLALVLLPLLVYFVRLAPYRLK